jgi:hypothetical protein
MVKSGEEKPDNACYYSVSILFTFQNVEDQGIENINFVICFVWGWNV